MTRDVGTQRDQAHVAHMRRCLELARMALARGEVPVGALVVDHGRIVGEGIESTRALFDPTAHAEAEAIRVACRAARSRQLPGVTLYTTVEPCVLCGYVARSVDVAEIVYGIPAGALGAHRSRYPLLLDTSVRRWGARPLIVGGVLSEECRALMDEYSSRRMSSSPSVSGPTSEPG